MGDGKYYGGYWNVELPSDRHIHVSLGIVSKSMNVTKSRYAVETSHEQHGETSKPIVLTTNSMQIDICSQKKKSLNLFYTSVC